MSKYVCNECGKEYGPCGSCPRCMSSDVTKIETLEIYLQLDKENKK